MFWKTVDQQDAREMVIAKMPAAPGWRLCRATPIPDDAQNMRLSIEPLLHVGILAGALNDSFSFGGIGGAAATVVPLQVDGQLAGTLARAYPPSERTDEEVLQQYREELEAMGSRFARKPTAKEGQRCE